MRRNPIVRRNPVVVASALVAAIALSACGQAGSSGTTAPPTSATGSGAGCAGIADDKLVVLDDDKHLQNTDNIVAAVNKSKSSPELLAALDKVASALDTPKLIALNKAVDVDRRTPKVAAEEFAAANSLTSGIAKGAGGDVIVGAANFTESQTLGELYSIALTAAGYTVKVQTIGNRELYEPALEKGEIHAVPEYAASLAAFLKATPSPQLEQTMAALKTAADARGIVVGVPSTAQDQNAFAVTSAFADKYGLRTLTDLAAKCSGAATVLGGPPECPQRPACQAGLVKTYNLVAGRFSSLDSGGSQTKNALKSGAISVGLVFSSDGALAAG